MLGARYTKLVDANVLLHAVNEDAPQLEQSREWLDWALGGDTTVAFAWVAMVAFLRLSTRRGVCPQPLSSDQAMNQAEDWLAQPSAEAETGVPACWHG